MRSSSGCLNSLNRPHGHDPGHRARTFFFPIPLIRFYDIVHDLTWPLPLTGTGFSPCPSGFPSRFERVVEIRFPHAFCFLFCPGIEAHLSGSS